MLAFLTPVKNNQSSLACFNFDGKQTLSPTIYYQFLFEGVIANYVATIFGGKLYYKSITFQYQKDRSDSSINE